jgi:hypothetical protein
MPSSSTEQTRELAGPPTEEGITPGNEITSVPKPARQYAGEMSRWGMQAGQVPGMESYGTLAATEAITAPRRQAEAEAKSAEHKETLRATLQAKVEAATAADAAQARRDRERAQDRQDNIRLAASLRPGPSELDQQLKAERLAVLKAPKPLPAAKQKALDDAELFVSHIDRALEEVNANPNALGKKTLIPDLALGTIDPEGVATRAAVAGLSAEKVHQLSGAAVSPAEFARLRPYLPASGDSADTARTKLLNLRKEAALIRDRHAGVGKSAPAEAPGGGPKRVASDADYNALPSGTVFIDPEGKQRRKP